MERRDIKGLACEEGGITFAGFRLIIVFYYNGYCEQRGDL